MTQLECATASEVRTGMALEEMTGSKALVLLSGGVDSTTLLAMACKRYGAENVVALSVTYGQVHSKELLSACAVAQHYGVVQKRIDMSAMFEGSDCSLLAGSGVAIPHESYAGQTEANDGKPVSTYVPFRNGLFLSAAAAVAISNDCDVIMYGAHRDDAAGNAYPDCSREFVAAMADAINIGSGKEVTMLAPFAEANKAGIVKQGLDLGVPYELTWSCYEGQDKPCGECGTCIDRRHAFEANGVQDPLEAC